MALKMVRNAAGGRSTHFGMGRCQLAPTVNGKKLLGNCKTEETKWTQDQAVSLLERLRLQQRYENVELSIFLALHSLSVFAAFEV